MDKKGIGLKNITPKSLNCVGFGCPAIYETKDDSYIIIGKLVTKSVAKELKNAISEDEVAIKVPKGLMGKLRKR